MKGTEEILAEKAFNDCLYDIMSYLVYSADEGYMGGGVEATSALDSFRIVLGYDQDKFSALCDIFRSGYDD